MKITYKITVGEAGNLVGHTTVSDHKHDDLAVRKAKRLASPYGGDGWWMVKSADGQLIAKGGREAL